jgi:putative ABC transport system ATP-binding protein
MAARTIEILKHIDLLIPAGQFVAIMGASGSGKSTLLGLLAGIGFSHRGRGPDRWHRDQPSARRQAGRSARPKAGLRLPVLSIDTDAHRFGKRLLPHELNGSGNGRAAAADLLRSVGLADRMHHYPVQLSGGEQQRVALARAFVLQPPIIFADEPTGNLDSENGAHVLDLLLERNRTSGATLVLVTHDAQVSSHADRRIVLRDGMIVEDTMQRPA